MSSDITLNAAMRANLLSLQNTSHLQAQTQGRLATGKKVNSALDNPTSFFAASSLNDRASDLSNLLDGMGQAIQTITAATQGITAAESIITQMQAVATTAAQSATSSSSSSQTVAAQGTVTTTRLETTDGVIAGTGTVTTDGAASSDSIDLLTNMTNGSGVNLGIKVGDTLVSSKGTGTYTVSAGSTLKDLQTFINSASGGASLTAIDAAGKLNFSASQSDVLTGNLVAELGLAAATYQTGTTTVANVIGLGPSQASNQDTTHLLTGLVDSSGKSLGIANGDTLTYMAGGGQAVTFTVGASNLPAPANGANGGGSTLYDLQAWLAVQNSGTGTTTSSITSGKLTVNNVDTVNTLVLGGNLAKDLGVNATIGTSGNIASTVASYVQPITKAPVATGTTLLSNLTRQDGSQLYAGVDSAVHSGSGTQVGDVVSITTYSGANQTGQSNITITSGMTVQNLLTQMNAVSSKLTFSINSAGNIVADNETGGNVKLGGTAQGLFVANTAYSTTALTVANNSAGSPTVLGVSLYAGFAPSSGSSTTTVSATSATQYDTLRSQLDQLIQDASYQGVNLISGTGNSPLKVQFNNSASNPNQLVINAVDLTSTGLSLTAATGTATGAWNTAADVQNSLSALTTANTTLRTQSSGLGTNLTTVQTRLDFTTNLINTLQTGAGDLVNADMNTESANMLALQTQQQLGISSLSLASQAAQGILKLFP